MFRAIARRLTNEDLQGVVFASTEDITKINLDQELGTIFRCVEKANDLISRSDNDDVDLAGVRNTRRILNDHAINNIPDYSQTTDNPKPFLRSLLETIEVGNTETGVTYRSPEKIQDGDPLSVFQWYLYDGYGRMTAIHLGISNTDKQQETDGDWISCSLTEAAVVLAEEGDRNAQKVVNNMIDMNFIAGGWFLTDQLVERAKILQE